MPLKVLPFSGRSVYVVSDMKDPSGKTYRGVRQQLSVALSDADLDRLVTIGLRVRPEVVASLVDCWNTGLPDAPERSRYAGPVLVVRGGDDGLVTEELVATAVSPRFASAQTVVIERAGHWPHLEQPAALAAQLDRFLTEHATSADGNVGLRKS